MVTVAIAGASTGLGFRITKATLALEKHKVIVLSRGPSAALASLGADVRAVDYTSHGSLVAALQGVHTVICAIFSFDGPTLINTQKALLNAALETGAKRFMPSEFGVLSSDFSDAYKPKIEVWNADKASGLECTRICCGLFLSILATGTPKGEEEALAGMRPWDFVINMKCGTADFVGDGNAPMSLITTDDIGRFTAACLDLDSWPDNLTYEGDRKSFRELVEIAEKVQNRKFLIKETSIEDVEREVREKPETAFYNQTRIHLAQGGGVTGRFANEKFPDIKPTTAQEFVERWWSGVEVGAPHWVEATLFNE